MHSLAEFGSNVPAFLAKLWKLVDDPDTNELICWSEEGTSFFIRDQSHFSRKLLPMYYKHNNMASFIRQLNMYGFHKIVSADAGSLRLDKDEMEFAHQCFLRGHPYLLEHIKRKVGKSQILSKQLEEGKDSASGGVVVKADFMNKILSEVKTMRGRQDNVESRLATMKQENEALWRELSLLRQKHIKQQNIVNKLIQFLVTLVQPSQRLSPKRRYPLMINNIAHAGGKTNGKVANMHNSDQIQLSLSLPASQSHMMRSPSGPTIHELDGDSILDENDADLLSDAITLHVPDTELTEEMGSSLDESGVLLPEALESLHPIIQQSALLQNVSSSKGPLVVNSTEAAETAEDILNEDLIRPELLLSVPPSDVNPAIVVPSLQRQKGAKEITSTGISGSSSTSQLPLASSKKIVTRSASGAVGKTPAKISANQKSLTSTKSMPASRKSAGPDSSSSLPSLSSKAIAVSKGAAGNPFTATGMQQAVKKELRVIPPRNRRKRSQTSNDDACDIAPEAAVQEPNPEDLLEYIIPEQTLPTEKQSDNAVYGTAASPLQSAIPTGTPCDTPSPPTGSPYVGFPMTQSPIPIVQSPVASPAACSPHSAFSPIDPLSGTTVTDVTSVTSPLVVYPPSEDGLAALQASPQPSPSGCPASPFMSDLTLACTSQPNSSPTNQTSTISSTAKSPLFNRGDLDLHIGSLDNELGQLKDLLHNSGIQLDANTLLGLFTSDDPLSYNMPQAGSDNLDHSPKNDVSGGELMCYQPDFMDLAEVWNEDSLPAAPSTPGGNQDISSEINTPLIMPVSPGLTPNSIKRRKV